MKIGIIRETKTPEDNRVALTPEQIIALQHSFPGTEFKVQSSAIRAYSDDAYRALGIPVVDSLEDCQVLFGIKEAKLASLLPGKHYFFFGHLAKFQEHNRPLLQKLLSAGITFSDYEYLVDAQNQRLNSFSWWAGFVGAYNTLRGYGLRSGAFTLPAPDKSFTTEQIYALCQGCAKLPLKIIITGSGQASEGAQALLQRIGFQELPPPEFLRLPKGSRACYSFLKVEEMLRHKTHPQQPFSFSDLQKNPGDYQSCFFPYACAADLLLVCHYWDPASPVHLTRGQLKAIEMNLQVVGDVTCDIPGSIESTLRSSTHSEPFFDYNPRTGKEEPPFSSLQNISCMAVDSLPNALPLEASQSFGEGLRQIVFPLLLSKYLNDPTIAGATIVREGKLTPKFAYLADFAAGHA
ncbi:MAG: alanine dehydrogenase [Oligosphaeraceae bacterium]|nr:alanine dehydrogenase [Oligosphaeraceae bacterium]